jgi:hypothetical protein
MNVRIVRRGPLHVSMMIVVGIAMMLVGAWLPGAGGMVAYAAGPPAPPGFVCTGTRFFESAGVGKIFNVGDSHLGGTFTSIEMNNFMVVRDPVTGVIVGGFNQPRRLGGVSTIEFNRTIRVTAILWWDNDPDASLGETGWSVNAVPGPATGHNAAMWTLENFTARIITIDAGKDSGGVDFCFEEVPAIAQGCTPGYWKVKQHWNSWVPTGYTPKQTLESVFDVPDSLGYDNKTLVQALGFLGGTSVKGAAQILLRAGVAALLNSSHPHVMNYPHSQSGVISAVNTALASNNRATMLALATQLDNDNNRGCPLN